MNSTGRMENNTAAPYNFTIGGLLGEAWQRVGGSKASYWGAFLIFFIITFGLNALTAIVPPPVTVLWYIAVWVISVPLSIGLNLMAVRRSVDLPIESMQIFKPYRCIWPLVGVVLLASLIAFVIILAGVCLNLLVTSFFITPSTPPSETAAVISLVIMGVTCFLAMVIYFGFLFAPLLVVEKNLGVIQALKTSFAGFAQHWFKIIITFIIMVIIYIISAIPLLIGIIWTLPMLLNLLGVLYRIIFGVDLKE